MRAIVTVVGKDQVGLTGKAATVLSENNINILDISQTILADFFTMVMLVDADKCELEFTELADILKQNGEKIGVDIRIQREDIFNAMHKI